MKSLATIQRGLALQIRVLVVGRRAEEEEGRKMMKKKKKEGQNLEIAFRITRVALGARVILG